MMSNTKYNLMMLRRRRRSVTCDEMELILSDTAMSSCGRTNSILFAPDDDARPILSGSTFKSKNHNPNKAKAKNSILIPFPVKLHAMLDKSEADGLADVVSWAAHGRCFCVHKSKEFVMHIMPQYFKQSKMTSFRRQLNLYGFKRLIGGLDRGGYYHESFVRGDIDLAYNIRRMRIKGTCVRSPTSPHTEPNFNVINHETKLNLNALHHVTKNLVISERVPDDYRDSLAHFKHQQHRYHQQQQQQQQETTKIDVIFFEGRPFHYIDSSELTILKNINRNQGPVQRSSSLVSLVNDLSSSSNNISEFDSVCPESGPCLYSIPPKAGDESICFPSYGNNDIDSEDDTMQSLSRSIDTEDDIDFFIKSIGIPTEISIIKNGVKKNGGNTGEEYQQY